MPGRGRPCASWVLRSSSLPLLSSNSHLPPVLLWGEPSISTPYPASALCLWPEGAPAGVGLPVSTLPCGWPVFQVPNQRARAAHPARKGLVPRQTSLRISPGPDHVCRLSNTQDIWWNPGGGMLAMHSQACLLLRVGSCSFV